MVGGLYHFFSSVHDLGITKFLDATPLDVVKNRAFLLICLLKNSRTYEMLVLPKRSEKPNGSQAGSFFIQRRFSSPNSGLRQAAPPFRGPFFSIPVVCLLGLLPADRFG